MTTRVVQPHSGLDRFLVGAAVAFAIGFSVHGLDHLHRGYSASPAAVVAGGALQALLVVIAVVMAVTHRRFAPQAAIFVGFGSSLLFTYAHLLPTVWARLQDSFISAPHLNVTWFSWVSAVAEIGTGIVFGIAGVSSLHVRSSETATVVR
jgi:hypothetical protein